MPILRYKISKIIVLRFMGGFYETDEVPVVIYHPTIVLKFAYNILSLLGCIILPPVGQHQAILI
jgi:hypothetical protein